MAVRQPGLRAVQCRWRFRPGRRQNSDPGPRRHCHCRAHFGISAARHLLDPFGQRRKAALCPHNALLGEDQGVVQKRGKWAKMANQLNWTKMIQNRKKMFQNGPKG